MKNKFIVASSIFLIFVLFLLVILVDLFKKKYSNQVISPTSGPTTIVDFQTNSSNSNHNSTEFSDSKIPQEVIDQINNLKSLTKEQAEELQNLKNRVPMENEDFEIEYSQDLEQFFVLEKTNKAKDKLKEFFAKDDLFDIYINNKKYGDIFVKGNVSAKELRRKAEQDYIQKKALRKDEVRPTQTQTPTDSPAKRDAKLIGGFIRLFTDNLDLIHLPRPTVTPGPEDENSTPTGSLTNIGLDGSNPLNAIFNEAGQKMNVPPTILKAIMAHECGSLLNETPENIIAWSQPGSGIPPSHRCYDGGYVRGDGRDLGPMQFYTTAIFNSHSFVVNSVGGYIHTPNVENIRDAVYASAHYAQSTALATSSNWTCSNIKRVSWCYACGCSRYDGGDLNNSGCKYAPGLFEYLWGYYTTGNPTNSQPC